MYDSSQNGIFAPTSETPDPMVIYIHQLNILKKTVVYGSLNINLHFHMYTIQYVFWYKQIKTTYKHYLLQTRHSIVYEQPIIMTTKSFIYCNEPPQEPNKFLVNSEAFILIIFQFGSHYLLGSHPFEFTLIFRTLQIFYNTVECYPSWKESFQILWYLLYHHVCL